MFSSHFTLTGARRRVKVNVGGRMFETTLGTLQVASKNSTLVKVVSEDSEPFFDRDPEPFAILLSMLRTGKIDDEYRETSVLNKLIREAIYYGLLQQLQTALGPDPLDGISVVRQKHPVTPIGFGDRSPFLLAPGADGSLWVGQGKRIIVYDWALREGVTTITEIPIHMLNRISDTHIVTGAKEGAQNFIHIYNVIEGTGSKSLRWSDRSLDGREHPGLAAITSNGTQILASCTSGKMPYSSLWIMDKLTMKIQTVIPNVCGDDEVGFRGTEHCKKLQWLPLKNLLLQGISFGGRSYVSLWDVRSAENVWQWKGLPHHEGAFADIVANEEVAGIFKVSAISGSVAMCDMRNLTAEYPWLTLGAQHVHDGVAVSGVPNRLLSHSKQLYVSRGGTLQVWCVAGCVPLAKGFKSEKKYTKKSFKRIIKDNCEAYSDDLAISHLAVGGDRLFVSRKSHVEVWESRRGV